MPNKLGEYIVPVYTFSDEQTAINNGYTEVIRCRDCKWYEEDIGCDWGVCFHDDWTHRDVGHGVDGDGYCYRTERKEE
jgi:hypothetical protein